MENETEVKEAETVDTGTENTGSISEPNAADISEPNKGSSEEVKQESDVNKNEIVGDYSFLDVQVDHDHDSSGTEASAPEPVETPETSTVAYDTSKPIEKEEINPIDYSFLTPTEDEDNLKTKEMNKEDISQLKDKLTEAFDKVNIPPADVNKSSNLVKSTEAAHRVNEYASKVYDLSVEYAGIPETYEAAEEQLDAWNNANNEIKDNDFTPDELDKQYGKGEVLSGTNGDFINMGNGMVAYMDKGDEYQVSVRDTSLANKDYVTGQEMYNAINDFVTNKTQTVRDTRNKMIKEKEEAEKPIPEEPIPEEPNPEEPNPEETIPEETIPEEPKEEAIEETKEETKETESKEDEAPDGNEFLSEDFADKISSIDPDIGSVIDIIEHGYGDAGTDEHEMFTDIGTQFAKDWEAISKSNKSLPGKIIDYAKLVINTCNKYKDATERTRGYAAAQAAMKTLAKGLAITFAGVIGGIPAALMMAGGILAKNQVENVKEKYGVPKLSDILKEKYKDQIPGVTREDFYDTIEELDNVISDSDTFSKETSKAELPEGITSKYNRDNVTQDYTGYNKGLSEEPVTRKETPSDKDVKIIKEIFYKEPWLRKFHRR